MLLNDDGKPVAVVEAKKENIDPLTAKEQARDKNLGVGPLPVEGIGKVFREFETKQSIRSKRNKRGRQGDIRNSPVRTVHHFAP